MKYNFFIVILFFLLALFSQTSGVDTGPGQTYAVVVGISDYQGEDIPDLRYADKDAEAFAEFLRSSGGDSLDEDHLKVLLNKEAIVKNPEKTDTYFYLGIRYGKNDQRGLAEN